MDPVSEEITPAEGVTGRDVAAELAASGALDELFARIDAGDIELTGDGGLIPGLIKAALERGLQAELTDHLGYEKGSAGGFDVRRTLATGRRARRSATQVGDIELALRVTVRARSRLGWSPRAAAGWAGWTR